MLLQASSVYDNNLKLSTSKRNYKRGLDISFMGEIVKNCILDLLRLTT